LDHTGWQQKFPRLVEKWDFILYNAAMMYKVVETSTVTDVEIEGILNEWTGRGYSFASIHFVSSQASRRPVMAFLFFTEPGECGPSVTVARTDT
jgi:hypothetical protein